MSLRKYLMAGALGAALLAAPAVVVSLAATGPVFVGPDGKVLDVLPGTPFSEAVIAPDEPARFVLELKAGTAARTGIADGVMLRHRAIAAAAGNPG
jgi:hypothetical protein